MNVVLWILQFLLAAMFLFHGFMLQNPPAQVTSNPMLGYVTALKPPFRKLIGVLEILAGLGLVLPMLFNVLPILTPLAAVGLVIVMIGAVVMHLGRNEMSNVGFNIVLLVLAAIVAYGRFTGVV
jgi:uncharacterized membrane protein YphA (DoxX/SURF4 family)